MKRVFGEEGLLARSIQGFEVRPQQAEMAEALWEALAGGRTLLVEAGTGTGKTWAYLAPVIMSGLKTVVSTGTKTLQEQILKNDIPTLTKALPKKPRVVLLKGRRNYLCLRRLNLQRQGGLFTNRDEADMFGDIADWARTTKTGEFSELADLPEGLSLFSDLSSGQEACLGQKCEHFKECFVALARRRAQEADLVIVNHHLFFADLALRAGGFGEVVPRYEAVVFDEAHSLEGVVLSHLGVSLSSHQVAELIRDTARELRAQDLLSDSLGRRITGLKSLSDAFFGAFPADAPRTSLAEVLNGDSKKRGDALARGLRDAAAELGRASSKEWLAQLERRAEDLAARLEGIIGGEEKGRVRWFEARGRGVFLHMTPVNAAPFLKESLLGQPAAMVFTSGTLTASGEFTFFKSRIGLEHEAVELVLPSPFDFMCQTLLYLPEDMPPPNGPDFLPALSGRLESLIRASRGRAFALFTSYRNMLGARELMGEGPGYPVYMQGELPRFTLLSKFRREVDSVLFGTYTFWEGVDVPGESLSCVIIDKLPFASPADPVLAERLKMMEEEGKNPFYEYQVPAAIISLKQGLGRLLRSRSDRGLLAVLDVRILKRSYGKIFVKSLPDIPVTHDLEEVAAFFDDAYAAGQKNPKER